MSREVYAVDLGVMGRHFVRCVEFPEVGDYVSGHDHGMDHVTLVLRGRVRFRCPVTDVDATVTAPGGIPTPAKARHDMIALDAGSCAWCVFEIPEDHLSGDTTRFS